LGVRIHQPADEPQVESAELQGPVAEQFGRKREQVDPEIGAVDVLPGSGR
jgi:hypothetical protein